MPGKSYTVKSRTNYRRTGANLVLEHDAVPEVRFVELDATSPAGRWRVLGKSNGLTFQANTDGDYDSSADLLTLLTTGLKVLGGSQLLSSSATPYGIQVTNGSLTPGSLGSIVLPVKTDSGAPDDAAGGNANGSIVYNSADNTIEIRDGEDTYLSVGVAGVVLQRRAPALDSGDGQYHPDQLRRDGLVDESRCFICGQAMLPGEAICLYANGSVRDGDLHAIYGHVHNERDPQVKRLLARVLELLSRVQTLESQEQKGVSHAPAAV